MPGAGSCSIPTGRGRRTGPERTTGFRTEPRALLRIGLDAVREVAAANDLPADHLEVLSARGNLVVRLAPAAVVARVAAFTAALRCDPAAWQCRAKWRYRAPRRRGERRWCLPRAIPGRSGPAG